jgi:hypothetical protein
MSEIDQAQVLNYLKFEISPRSRRLINIFNRQVKSNSGTHFPDEPEIIP